MRFTRKCCSQALASFRGILDAEISGIKAAGTYKNERVITTRMAAEIGVNTHADKVLNFCANNYLGLSSHPDVIQASKDTLEQYGAGLSSVRFICGTQTIHKELEAAIAKFHGMEDCILYISCFDANAGIFETLLTPEDAVFSDQLNHASIIDGIRLAKCQKHRYLHRDMADLEKQLTESTARVKLIVTDGVFSMDGTIAPLPEICDIAERTGALVFLDECHSTGFMGATGRGTPELCNVSDKITFINSTLGKALGGACGGYTAGPKEAIELLRQRSRPYLFSNTLPPSVVGGTLKVFELLNESTDLPDLVARNTRHFRTRMTDAGFTLSGQDHPIAPVMLYDAALASSFADALLEKGIYVIGFSFPVVPKGLARIRVQLSASHSVEQIDRCVDAFIEVGREKGVIA